VSVQQQVQIAGAVGKGARVLVFDEPTSSLTQREVELLFEQMRKLKQDGVTCIYVSHRLEEIFTICDRVTVLRDGCHIGTEPIENLNRDSIVRMMIGRDIVSTPPKVKEALGEPLLQVRGISSPGKFSDISFDVRGGEILGLAGLVGAGRTEIAEAVFGLDPDVRGTIAVKGKQVRPKSPSQMMEHGVGLVPEDRKRHGLVLMMNSRENISLAILSQIQKIGFTKHRKEREVASRYFKAMRVKAPTLDTPSAGLSGGNQQKLVIAKWLAAECDVLILDELADQGKAVIVISSELPELLSNTDRILALHNGRITGESLSANATEESLLQMMTGAAVAS
jgi:ABC-type sugar transport system ATPase subunit